MVATVANAVSAVTGPAGVSVGAAGNTAGQAESEFSQLLDGMDVDATTVATPVVSALAGKAKLDDAATTATDAGNLTAEMLAMFATPLAAAAPVPVPVQIPPLIAASASGTQTVNQSAVSGTTTLDELTARPPAAITQDVNQVPVALTDGTDVVADTAVTTSATNSETGSAGALTTQDMQWLRSGARIAGSENTAAPRTKGYDIAPMIRTEPTVVSATEAATAATQVAAAPAQPADIYQQLLTQVAPLVATATGQRFERQLEAVKTDTTTTAVDASAVLSGVATQPAGTQLATDALAFDAAPRHQLHAAIGSHQWATELGNKLTMLASKDTQSATLYMTPADLGPVQVRIDLHQNEASVWFTAEHAETRSALEQSLPRLRDMFTAQGMSLTDAGVFGDRSRQQPGYVPNEQNRPSASRSPLDAQVENIAAVRGISLSMLDAYA